MRNILVAFLIIVIFAVPWLMVHPDEAHMVFAPLQYVEDQVAAILVAHNPKTVAEIQSDYAGASSRPSSAHVRILLVPGHEPDYGGAEFGSLKERNMTVELAQDLQKFLGSDGHYHVFTTRDTQNWNPIFTSYFQNEWNQIAIWEQAHKDEITHLERIGEFKPVSESVIHNDAPNDVAMRIYGIDKWADDNNIDIVIHIHFNDYPDHPRGTVGKYSGFAIYVPESQYSNGTTTRVLAESISKRLGKYNAVSNLPGESSGIVQDQDLIAIGAYNSVDAASMLIEYGYIYEPQFTNATLRSSAISDLAYQTYLGLEDFFDPSGSTKLARAYDTLTLPHIWPDQMSAATASSSDVFALQSALVIDGVYPPSNMSMNDCPRSGRIGPCTKSALEEFQKKYDITGEDGVAGPKTMDLLNSLYSNSM